MTVEAVSGSVVTFSDFNHPFHFFIESEKDLIQSHHKKGELYEREELLIIQKNAADTKIFLDIGANVGNHAIFMAKVLGARRVYAFEANPFTANILEINVALNRLSDLIDTSYSKIGLGDQIEALNVVYPQVHNLGAARLSVHAETVPTNYPTVQVPVAPIDSFNLSPMQRVGFVKLDVEGMELKVLRGGARFFATHRPRMFIEVDNSNVAEFHEWIEANDYVIIDRFKRYTVNENFLIVPR
jgi:FkbM family methyltransferase